MLTAKDSFPLPKQLSTIVPHPCLATTTFKQLL